jgi:hypothetical protein
MPLFFRGFFGTERTCSRSRRIQRDLSSTDRKSALSFVVVPKSDQVIVIYEAAGAFCTDFRIEAVVCCR